MIDSGIYWIKNTINNFIYIGSTSNWKRRKINHLVALRKNIHPNKYLQNAWNKYSENNFKFELIEKVELIKEKLLEREQYWMDYYKSYERDRGYNLCITAGSTFGIKLNAEARINISHGHLGNKNWKFRKPYKHTLERIEKIRFANLGKIVTEETKQKQRGPKSLEHCRALSLAAKNRKSKITHLELSINWDIFSYYITEGFTSKQIAVKFGIKSIDRVKIYCKKHFPELLHTLNMNNKKAQILNGKNLQLNRKTFRNIKEDK